MKQDEATPPEVTSDPKVGTFSETAYWVTLIIHLLGHVVLVGMRFAELMARFGPSRGPEIGVIASWVWSPLAMGTYNLSLHFGMNFDAAIFLAALTALVSSYMIAFFAGRYAGKNKK